MTERQRKKFFFPRWNAACAAHDWRMEKGRLVGKRLSSFISDEINKLYQAVWNAAELMAVQAHCAVTERMLRHGCTAVALGRFKPTEKLTNQEISHVANLFRILADPLDLDALVSYLHPENYRDEEMVKAISRLAPEAYIQSLADDMFAGADWQSLDLEDMTRLHRKLKDRRPWQQSGQSQNPQGFKAPKDLRTESDPGSESMNASNPWETAALSENEPF